jgi:hypothetical protein
MVESLSNFSLESTSNFDLSPKNQNKPDPAAGTKQSSSNQENNHPDWPKAKVAFTN